MTNELTLTDLHDIVEPAAASAWPPAPGIWIALGIALAVIGTLVFLRWRTYHKNAYRRAALAELEMANRAGAIAEILKRTALTAYPRELVIGLRGDEWFEWLEAEGGSPCSAAVRSAWDKMYSDTEIEASALKTYTREWITNHAGI